MAYIYKKKTRYFLIHLVLAILFIVGLAIIVTPARAGDSTTIASDVSDMVDLVAMISKILGVIFALFGIVKYIISHASEQGDEMYKSVMLIALGVVLVVVPVILQSVNWENIIKSDAANYGETETTGENILEIQINDREAVTRTQ
jgi:hypothetical protein